MSILLHIGLVAFHFHFPKFRHFMIFMLSGASGHVHDSPNQLFLILDTPDPFSQIKSNTNSCKQAYYLGNLEISKCEVLEATHAKTS